MTQLPIVVFSCGRLLVRWSRDRKMWRRRPKKHGPDGFAPLKYEVVSYVLSRLVIQWITRVPVTGKRYYNINTDDWDFTAGWDKTSWKDTDIYAKPDPPSVPLVTR